MTITKKMSIMEVVQNHPETVDIFRNYGMGCLGCAAARFENIEQGAAAHGIDIDALVADLNKTVAHHTKKD
ncbi:hypothetical protein P22_0088 [Propionispora sp. 2/2-37]|uniref:DUF1858 domain-containing protein n=1 Tax=Propionispora sp. 2/2-37 TaxID=1677858 RepID=UPI0006BB8F61|nr:DUF1858 domain-containing protein [Propionispora sp. 2/2-37]CUH94026.1 hypothetical protein P22_0088 [Propionispora sp. 2/2-37]